MARNKYGFPIPKPIKTARHKAAYADGGLMGLFDRETDAEKAKRYDREATARIKAKEDAAKARPARNLEEYGAQLKAMTAEDTGPTRSADVFASDPKSVAGRIKARRDIAADIDTQVEGKKKGGLVKGKKKARGIGCAQRGHGKGRMC